MTALPPLPDFDEDLQGKEIAPGVYERGYTTEQVEAIRRDVVEACARIVEAQTQRGRRLYAAMNAEEVAACQYAAAVRALLEKQP